MMTRAIKWTTLLGVLLSGVLPAQAALVNPGFETGDLTGWTDSTAGTASVLTSEVGEFGTYSPGGSYFLAINGDTAGAWQEVSQTVTLSAGDTLSGWAALDWHDYASFYDEAQVQILDSGSSVIATPFFAAGSSPNYADYAPVFWSWTATTGGIYTLVYGSRNIGDSALPSTGLFDAATITYTPASVPEPGTMTLVGLGAFGLVAGAIRRRRSEKIAA